MGHLYQAAEDILKTGTKIAVEATKNGAKSTKVILDETLHQASNALKDTKNLVDSFSPSERDIFDRTK